MQIQMQMQRDCTATARKQTTRPALALTSHNRCAFPVPRCALAPADQICFTTEIVTSGTLKQYTNRVKSIKLKVIKKWCRQILTALDYLHSHDPPIIHRDLKCVSRSGLADASDGDGSAGEWGRSLGLCLCLCLCGPTSRSC